MIRLTCSQPDHNEYEVHIEGHLDAAALPQLQQMLSTLPPGARPTLMLAGLRSVDAPARQALVGLVRSGVRIAGASVYVAHLLQEDPS